MEAARPWKPPPSARRSDMKKKDPGKLSFSEAVTEVEVVQLRGGARLVVGEAVW